MLLLLAASFTSTPLLAQRGVPEADDFDTWDDGSGDSYDRNEMTDNEVRQLRRELWTLCWREDADAHSGFAAYRAGVPLKHNERKALTGCLDMVEALN